jgi:hypothetical protein
VTRIPASRRQVLGVLVAVVASLHLYASPATGTIEDQRAHLPPPEECGDPVEGVWVSKRFIEGLGDWYEFTLEIHRTGERALTGEIQSHFWSGPATSDVVPKCSATQEEAFISMPAAGRLEPGPNGDQVSFGGTSYKIDRIACGTRAINYLPDKFSGTIDRQLQEFQSVNNDGGSLVNEPAVFRRVRCFAAEAVAPAPPVPPSSSSGSVKAPASQTRGCGCNL